MPNITGPLLACFSCIIYTTNYQQLTCFGMLICTDCRPEDTLDGCNNTTQHHCHSTNDL